MICGLRTGYFRGCTDPPSSNPVLIERS
jgi:hypothetical protein